MTEFVVLPITSLPPDADFVTIESPRPQIVKTGLLRTVWTIDYSLRVALIACIGICVVARHGCPYGRDGSAHRVAG
jgi:hypothetical protein